MAASDSDGTIEDVQMDDMASDYMDGVSDSEYFANREYQTPVPPAPRVGDQYPQKPEDYTTGLDEGQSFLFQTPTQDEDEDEDADD